jgi:hypothetical protein
MKLFSTPRSRNRARDNAARVGALQLRTEALWSRRGELLDSNLGQVGLLVLAVVLGLWAGAVENW